MAVVIRRGGTIIPKVVMKTTIKPFVAEIKKFNSYMSTVYDNMIGWADTNGRHGAFSRALAIKTIQVIIVTIYTQGSGQDAARVSWSGLDSRYKKWKEENFGSSKIWSITGSVTKSFTARKKSGSYEVGLDRRVKVPRIQYGSHGHIGKGQKIPIETYFAENEMKRPLLAPSLLKVMQEDYPELVSIVKQSLIQSVRSAKVKVRVSVNATATQVDAESLQQAAELIAMGGMGVSHGDPNKKTETDYADASFNKKAMKKFLESASAEQREAVEAALRSNNPELVEMLLNPDMF